MDCVSSHEDDKAVVGDIWTVVCVTMNMVCFTKGAVAQR